MDHKLTHSKQQLNHIVNTKVFIQGSGLVHELDKTSRQMRLIKENVNRLEHDLTEKIRLKYDKDLDTAQAQLADIKT